jgi:hypothetical protein
LRAFRAIRKRRRGVIKRVESDKKRGRGVIESVESDKKEKKRCN